MRGVSLLETMIASTVFCLCLGCILMCLPTGFMSMKDSERRLYASSLAQKTLEEKRNLPLEALDGLAAQPTRLPPVDYQDVRYQVVLEVSRHPRVQLARNLKVTVTWQQHGRDVALVRESTECRVRR